MQPTALPSPPGEGGTCEGQAAGARLQLAGHGEEGGAVEEVLPVVHLAVRRTWEAALILRPAALAPTHVWSPEPRPIRPSPCMIRQVERTEGDCGAHGSPHAEPGEALHCTHQMLLPAGSRCRQQVHGD